jgi:hypothetical protein
MIRYIITESGNHEVGPSVTAIHKNQAAAMAHMDTIRRNYRKDGYVIVENADFCFTVTKKEWTTTFAMQVYKFD